MDCKHWNDHWVAYLYDECSAEEREDIERHLAGCEACRSHMNALDVARQAMHEAAPEIATPPRVIVLPARPRRGAGIWGFTAGFAAAAAVFAIGIFVGMNQFSRETTVLETADRQDLPRDAGPVNAVGDGRDLLESGIQQVRNDYEVLDDRLGRIERWLPEPQGDTLPRLATEDRIQVAVGNLTQEFDVIRTRDLQLFMQAIYAAEQTARQRDVTLSQAIEIMSAEYNPNVSQR
jgi:hypothetical protein